MVEWLAHRTPMHGCGPWFVPQPALRLIYCNGLWKTGAKPEPFWSPQKPEQNRSPSGALKKNAAKPEPSKTGAKPEPSGALSDWLNLNMCVYWELIGQNELLCFVMCKHLIGWIKTCIFTESWLVKTSCYVLWCVNIWLVEFIYVCLLRVDWSKTSCYVLWCVNIWLVEFRCVCLLRVDWSKQFVMFCDV